MDALYFRVSSERQTTENEFEDLLQVAERDDSGRDWGRIRQLLAECIQEEERDGAGGTRDPVYRVVPGSTAELAQHCVYVKQGRSGKVGAKGRPLFERMKHDAAERKFDRLLVWKVSRLGRDMLEVLNTVHQMAELGITVYPVKSQVGPVNSSMAKLLWAILAWFGEMENEERSEAVTAGQIRARAEGKSSGRPRAVFPRDQVGQLRRAGRSWRQIAAALGVGVGTVRRVAQESADSA